MKVRLPTMDPGDYVIDREDDDPDIAIVLYRSETPIGEWTIEPSEDEERTVAEDNPEYDKDETVVVVAFVEALNQEWRGWTNSDPEQLYDAARQRDVKCYHFPQSRLEVLDEEEVTEFTSETTDALDDLQARLDDADWQTEIDQGVLVVEKIDEEYRIHPSGEVEGEGEMREPLENLVAEYLE